MAAGINGATDFFSFPPPVTGEPFTMSCWVYAPTLGNRFVVRLAGGVSDYHGLLYLSDGTAIARSFRTGDGSFNGQSTTTGFTAATWHHLCGVWSSTSNRQVFLNGSSGAANTTSKSVASLATASVATTGVHHIADLSIWNVVLTQAEISSLADGFSGSRIRRGSLLLHAPLIRARREIHGTALTDGGTPTVETHPPIIGAIAA